MVRSIRWVRNVVGSREGMSRMLGVFGGMAALLGVLVGIVVTGLDYVVVIREDNIEVPRSLVGMSWALVGVLGGVMSWRNPVVPGVVMLVSGIAGLVTMPAYFSAGGGLLLSGAVIALTTRGRKKAD